AVAVAFDALQHLDGALAADILAEILVARDAQRVDEADIELARDDGGGDEAAARHRDDAAPRPPLEEPPGERLGVAVQLLPADGKGLLMPQDLGHGVAGSPQRG